jgi:hypothetical protein
MKRVFSASAGVAFLCLGFAFSGAASAQNIPNLQNAPSLQNAPGAQNAEELNIRQGVSTFDLTSAQPTRGVVFFTAAINSNGSVASCFGCNTAKTSRVAPGRYVVNFGQNVQAINGWSRWVQPDTLQTGIVGTLANPGASCTTADSAADSNAVWVNCQHSGGPGSQGQSTFFDTSFFLFVAR